MREVIFEDAYRPGQAIAVTDPPIAYEAGPRPGTTWLTLPGNTEVAVFGDSREVRARVLAAFGGPGRPATAGRYEQG